ncbi:unnamed protein product [Peronospora farinosa]|uniref:RING-type domain-containing protein n=1 Tax=Peronospora farinosa TaxID=134698 RepID=A0AAV0TH73_9STRA|nr:unnamed protein product [Peronospora farinosa]CAI5720233.1 unnamed protein product [Peronospora farinosa]
MSCRQACASCFNVGYAVGGLNYGLPIHRVMPCGHVFCKPCITQRCALALTNRALVPAHCCGMEFPTEYVMEALEHTSYNTYSRLLSERQWINSTLRSDVEYAATVKKEWVDAVFNFRN